MTITVDSPAALAVPVIWPVEAFIDSPVGSPLALNILVPEPPEAEMLKLKAWPKLPESPVVGVTTARGARYRIATKPEPPSPPSPQIMEPPPPPAPRFAVPAEPALPLVLPPLPAPVPPIPPDALPPQEPPPPPDP